MAYQQIGTCRIFINALEWLSSNGSLEIDAIFRTLPVNPVSYSEPIANQTLGVFGTQSFVALLGHRIKGETYSITDNNSDNPTLTDIVNGGTVGFNGYSISTFDGTDLTSLEVGGFTGPVGSLVLGNYWESPVSPDAMLSINYETNTKTIQTKGGASLSNTMGSPPKWGDLAQWELNDPSATTTGQDLAHKSRRIYNLKFSFMDQTNMFPKYNALNRYSDETLSETALSTTDDETLLDSGSFFSAVWEKVGSSLPVIFQPDNTVNEFAIVKIVGNTLKVTEVAHRIYSISLKLAETW